MIWSLKTQKVCCHVEVFLLNTNSQNIFTSFTLLLYCNFCYNYIIKTKIELFWQVDSKSLWMTDFFSDCLVLQQTCQPWDTTQTDVFSNCVQLSNLASANLSSRCRTISKRKEEQKPPELKVNCHHLTEDLMTQSQQWQRVLPVHSVVCQISSALSMWHQPPTLLRHRGSRSSLFSATKICRQI